MFVRSTRVQPGPAVRLLMGRFCAKNYQLYSLLIPKKSGHFLSSWFWLSKILTVVQGDEQRPWEFLMHNKMNRFLPPAGDWSLEGEFECWHPDAGFAYLEKPGLKDGGDRELPYIDAEFGVGQADIPKQLLDMASHCWQKGSAPASGGRGGVQIGGARGNAFSGMATGAQQKLTDAGKYFKQVAPTAMALSNNYAHLQGIATDWTQHVKLKRFCAYTFRGDTRAPLAIRTAGGFSPPSTRTDDWYFKNVLHPQFAGYMKRRFNKDVDWNTFNDAFNISSGNDDSKKRLLLDYSIWRALADREALHMGRMLAEEALKGYISTTRCVTVAKAFAKANGWVYLTLVRGGFHVPAKKATAWTEIFGEQELAFPGKIDWRYIFAFRQVGPKTKFVGPIYFRKGFDTKNCSAFMQAHDLLSGKVQ